MFVESEQSACLVCLRLRVQILADTCVLQKRRFAGVIVIWYLWISCVNFDITQIHGDQKRDRPRTPGLPHLTLEWLSTNVLSHHGVPPQVAPATQGLITKGHRVSRNQTIF